MWLVISLRLVTFFSRKECALNSSMASISPAASGQGPGTKTGSVCRSVKSTCVHTCVHALEGLAVRRVLHFMLGVLSSTCAQVYVALATY